MGKAILETFHRQIETLCQLKNVSRVLNWDHQIVMPGSKRAATVRGHQRGALARLCHKILTSDEFGTLLERCHEATSDEPDSVDALCVKRWKRERRRATSVSEDLVDKLSTIESEAFSAWREAKQEDDFAIFLPYLDRMFELKREQAEQLGYQTHPYDAHLDEFEPGMTTAEVSRLFSELRPGLVDGVEKISASPLGERIASGPFDQGFPVEGQEAMAKFLAWRVGFPAENRIDAGTHPFCSAASSHDVRLVTRYREHEIATSIFATLHEAGHAVYETHSPPELEFTPLRGGCSLGVHESQARLWENLVGRSAPFWQWFTPHMREMFPTQISGYEWTDLYAAANRVRPTLIRVEADEVTYSLHIILRFEIACGLLDGSVKAKDVPDLWNQKMAESLGVTPPSDALGCLQDIHWSDGLVGYFPTYVLGNLIAADLWTKLEADLPNLQSQMSQGEFGALLGWLSENLYHHAAKYDPPDLLQRVLGRGIQVKSFLDYLKAKYSDLYQVSWS